MSLICVQNLSFIYEHSQKKAVDDVSFKIEQGSYTAIVGDNGSGKSTLARLICGLETPLSGSVTVQKGLQIGLVFQNPKNQIVSGIVSRDTAFGPQNLNLSKAETELRVIESLNIVGMLERASSSTLALSLGQTQKVALGGIIALSPDILIMDEALSMLDPVSRAEIHEFLDYWHARGHTIIHITHDAEALEHVTNIIRMKNGKIVENDAEKLSDLKSLFAEKKSAKTQSEPALIFEDVSFFYNEKYGVSNVNFQVQTGQLVALTGPSGCGKSTVLELSAGLLKPENGKIYSSGKIALCQQNAEGALFEAFAADDVAFGPRNQGKSGSELVQIVKSSMNKAGLPFEDFGERYSFQLSGGEQRRLAIAGILALDSPVILFDEPTAGLDEKSRIHVLKMLRTLCDEEKTVIFSTHKMDEADLADKKIDISEFTGKNTTHSHASSQISAGEKLREVEILSASGTLETLRKASAAFSKKSEKNSPLAKLPPVLKLVIFAALFLCVIVARNMIFAGSILAVSFIYCALAKFPMKKLFGAILKIIPFLMIFALFQMMFFPPEKGEILYTSLRFWTVSPSKIRFCVASFFRTVSSICLISGFYFSTPEYDLIDGFSVLLKPLALVKIPVRYFILILEIIFRFIPLLIDESSTIIKTQCIRGGLGNAKGKMQKIKGLIPLFVPIISQTIKRAEALADAITARCFR